MTRQEHLAWCKERALEYVDAGDINNGVTFMFSDLKKHKETEMHAGIELGMMLMVGGQLSTAPEARKFIDGFN